MKNRLPFPILHEDRDIIVIDKPAGLLSASTRTEDRRSAEAMLTDYLRKGQLKSSRRVYLVHRLDRETSGVMMFAKSEDVATRFRDNWHELTKKVYLARVEGIFPDAEGVFESYLKDNPRTMKVSSVDDPSQGKYAYTRWRRISVAGKTTLMEIELETGRKNQIRVHFAEAGHPVVGDVKYGAAKADRVHLHSRRLSFIHPHSGKWLEFASPIRL